MTNDWNKKFAFYAVALYRVGNYTDAALVGAIMFEKAIKNIFKTGNLIYPDSYSALSDAIKELLKRQPNKYNETQLYDIKRLRNKIIHELDINEIERENILPMVLFNWKILDESSYKEYNKNVDNIDFLTADYSIVDIREMFNENLQDILAKDYKFNTFELEDFQELHKLRNKMISLGSKIKKEILKIDYKKELYIDIISKIDTTSAYVWMTMNLYNEERKRIDSASASILGTPLDLRIYFDIGGGGYQVRQDYYKFLSSDYFTNFRDNIDLESMEIFDNDWYCFVVNRMLLSDLTTEDMHNQIKKSEEKLAEYDEHSKISWNRMLCGYIIKRGEISFADIKKKLEVIIKLYYCFEHFRQRELKREEISFNYNVGSLCSKQNKPKIYSAKNLNIKGKK